MTDTNSRVRVRADGTVEIEAQVTATASLSSNDIFNWLTACSNPETLEYLGKYALRLARGIRNPSDSDEFHSL